jgi:hypothetical protein
MNPSYPYTGITERILANVSLAMQYFDSQTRGKGLAGGAGGGGQRRWVGSRSSYTVLSFRTLPVLKQIKGCFFFPIVNIFKFAPHPDRNTWIKLVGGYRSPSEAGLALGGRAGVRKSGSRTCAAIKAHTKGPLVRLHRS